MNVIGKLLNGQSVDQADSGLSKREWTEMMQILDHYKS